MMSEGFLSRSSMHRLGNRALYTRDLLRELIARDLKVRYKRSYLGIIWSFMTPLCQIAIFSFLFTRVIPLEIPHYTAFVFVGILAWNFFSGGLSSSADAVVSNPELARRPGFPVAVLPVLAVANGFVHFLLTIPVLLLVVILGGGRPGLTLTALPLVVFLQFYLIVGFAYLIAACNVRFRDTQHLVGVLLLGSFYLTPIFYGIENVPEHYRFLYDFNPMAKILTAYRDILIYNRLPETEGLLMVFVVGCLFLAIGYTVFERARSRFVEEL